MKKMYCSPQFPTVTAMELDKEREITEFLLRKELQRLIAMEKPQVAINQAMDYLRTLPEKPIDREEILELMMQTDEIYNLLQVTTGIMQLATPEIQEEYDQKTLMSFLEELMNWEETR